MTRVLTTATLSATAVAGLVTAFVVGTTVGSGGGGGGGVPRGGGGGHDAVVAAYAGSELAPAASCDDLLDWYVERGTDLVGAWGFGGPPYDVAEGAASDSSASSAGDAPRAPQAAAAGTVRQTNGETGTNVQESGVDEPDSVKTDGTTLFRVDGDELATYDVSGADVVRLGSVDLPQRDGAEILLAGSTALAIGQDTDGDGHGASTRVAVVDVSDPADPVVRHTWTYDTALVTARLHGGTVRLVLQAGLPDLDFAEPGSGWLFSTDEDEARDRNRRLVEQSTIDDWLPHVALDDGDAEPLLGCDQVGLPDDESGLGTIAVVGLDLEEAADAREPATSVTGLAVDIDLAYASADRLFLATSAATAGWSECFECVWPRSSVEADGSSRLYSFALTGRDTTYVASGEVEGTLRDRWSIDEADGVLRVAVGRSSRTDDANSVVTLREEGDDLVEVGRLGGLGRGEDIQSVRWFDTLAIVVTFRQTDPLHAVDLTDPASPTLLGELHVPGFSSYLHPLGSDRMIGVGEGPGDPDPRSDLGADPDPDGAGWGAQVGLFDVTDLTAPRRIALTHYGPDTYALAATDPRQLTWLPDQRTVLTVIGDYTRDTGWVSVLHLDDGTMTDRQVEVEHGDEIVDVRLVPLPDGRVVLVTGDDASFLDLG